MYVYIKSSPCTLQLFYNFNRQFTSVKLGEKKEEVWHKHVDLQLPLKNQTHRKLDVLSIEPLVT